MAGFSGEGCRFFLIAWNPREKLSSFSWKVLCVYVCLPTLSVFLRLIESVVYGPK